MNQLYYGDNLEVMRDKIPDNSVDLCYIDPPFNSNRNYSQIYHNQGSDDVAQAIAFTDTWEWGDEAVQGLEYINNNTNINSGKIPQQTHYLILGLMPVLGPGSLMAYLIHMTLRIVEIQRVLKDTGSFYLHCDPTASHYLKLLCDSVFITQGGDFRNEIIWKRKSSTGSLKVISAAHDVILRYSKTQNFYFNQIYTKLSEEYSSSTYKLKDERGLYRLHNVVANPALRGNSPRYEYKGFIPKTRWLMTLDKLEAMDKENRLCWSKTGTPYRKIYLEESKGNPLNDVWTDIANVQGNQSLGYDTQKPEALLDRIIQASSKDGDVVLDAYCGCGTTVAVAQRLNRTWIGIDITFQSIMLILYRLEKAYPTQWNDIRANLKLDGIPQDIESAIALATKGDPLRKEFEKWAILTYTDNQAMINNRKGADGGIDGSMYFSDIDSKGTIIKHKVVFQVKSGKVARGDIAKLNSDRQREQATLGIFITLNNATKQMQQEAFQVGKYHHKQLGLEYPIIDIVTVAEILSGKLLSLPLIRAVVKSAEAKSNVQLEIEIE